MAGSIPILTPFSLADVCAITGGTSLRQAFANSVDGYFHPTYKGSKDRLSNFRGYNDPGTYIRSSGANYRWNKYGTEIGPSFNPCIITSSGAWTCAFFSGDMYNFTKSRSGGNDGDSLNILAPFENDSGSPIVTTLKFTLTGDASKTLTITLTQNPY